MKIEITSSFRDKLKRQIQYISKDKPQAARKFNQLVFQEIRKLSDNPKKNRISIFFDDKNIRDLVIKGYLIVYEILPHENKIVVFGFYKWEENL
ncbi:type II toxin-antitoxin system RelE/ParE family toxin [Epilithonimonas pallida]|uniref:Addiction module toxin, RelE/StbE family n=1 Tax=Epilithonimonas pallida TaxID=373671 RepID=A0ABY1R1P4_9FLAO|nr:type II toxin-antitoxin system RelE/ParE family toxin [Epilithonimonas pallida]SMP91754.1 addiction module toxin, RelE/StbE family [Epilithonimonas pallida]